MKRILIVDDSALVRKQLREVVETMGGFEIDLAKNGKEAVEKALLKPYDVITMDINMPIMDGLAAVKEIMDKSPQPILMVSSLTHDQADTTIEALENGAVDYIGKPGTMNVGLRENQKDLEEKIIALSRIPKRRLISRPKIKMDNMRKVQKVDDTKFSSRDIKKIILIGASTGGPGLIEKICSSLPSTFPHPICIVQHMPEQFTKSFAQRIGRVSRLNVSEISEKEEIRPGHIYIAAGGVDFHFGKKVSGTIVARLDSSDKGRFFQPSVDEMMLSAIKVFGADKIYAVLLTGIGDDGAEGMVEVKKGGGHTLGESEESATVYGMPKCAYDAGGVSEQLSFDEILKKIVTFR